MKTTTKISAWAARLWDALIHPHAPLTSYEDQEHARLFGAILLTLSILVTLFNLMMNLGQPPQAAVQARANLITIMVILGLLALYWLNRRGYLKGTSYAGIGFMVAMITITASPIFGTSYLSILNYFALTTLAASLILPLQRVVLLVIFQQVVAGLWVGLSVISEHRAWWEFLSFWGPFVTPAMTSVLVLVSVWFRNKIEAVRRAEITESESRYRSLVELSPDAIVVTGEGRFLYLNPAARTLFEIGDTTALEKLHPLDLIHPEDREAVRATLESTERERVPQQQRMVLPNGKTITVEAIGTRIRFEGQMARQSVIRDIGQRLEAERRKFDLASAQQRKESLEKFIQDISHDLKTPITGLVSSGYVLEQYILRLLNSIPVGGGMVDEDALRATAEAVEQRLDGLRENADRLTHLLNVVADMARLDQQESLEMDRTPFNRAVKEAWERLIGRAEPRDLVYIFEPDLMVGDVPLNISAFTLAVQNLIVNAIQYTPPGGRVIVRTRQQPGEVVLEVEDTGIGIAPEDLPRIFDRFFLADPARSAQSGSGLGLPIVSKIVTAHSGRIEVESKLNEGSTFRVCLPAETTATSAASPSPDRRTV